METHTETIQCPECGEIQKAEVKHTVPFYTYIHECGCGYIITESDWENVPMLSEKRTSSQPYPTNPDRQ